MPDILQLSFGTPVLTTKSLRVLSRSFSQAIERLSLDCMDCELFALSIHNQCDCLIDDKSDVRKNQFGNIIDVKSGVFDEAEVEGEGLFRIPQTLSVYATEVFMKAVDDNGLTGMRKIEVGYTVRL